jgi:hypothetical protein
VGALVLLNLAGGDCVEDLGKLESDRGFCEVLRRAETFGMRRRERRELLRRWRKERRRAVPSASAARRYLAGFHDEGEEAKRIEGKAFIPAPRAALVGLGRVNAECAAFLQGRASQETATLDMDATLVEAHKQEALFCYKKHRAYQPLNVWWAEQQYVVRSEFRDGNVPAGHEQRRVLEEALEELPAGVERVLMRSDTAGYEWELLRYCAEGKSQRFGVIEFAVGVDVTDAFKAAVHTVEESDWKPLRRREQGYLVETDQEWAEVCFVPNESARKKNGPAYRFLAIREALRQLELPGVVEQRSLPFPTVTYGNVAQPRRYKLFGIVTNRDLPGEELIWWHRERCGKSEEAHAVMKDDLAGGRLPSKLFGANAAWWAIMILALNLNTIMKRLVLGERWMPRRMKAIRYWLINVPGRLVRHARQLVVRISRGHPSIELLIAARQTIAGLAHGPPS